MKTARSMLRTAVALFAYTLVLALTSKPWLLAIILVLVIARLRTKKAPELWSHGTARWAEVSDLKSAGMLGGKQGLIIGRVEV